MFITACNPWGKELVSAGNLRLHADLGRTLERLGLEHIEGIGQHPSNGWPGEPGYLVFGVAREAVRNMGRALQQNAILWSDADAVPRLVLLCYGF